MDELESWEYKGTGNQRTGSRIRWNDLGTLEFRCGNMSFDYPVIVKRIIHAQDICRRLKAGIKNPSQLKLESLNKQLKMLEEGREDSMLSTIIPKEVAQEVIKSRNIRI